MPLTQNAADKVIDKCQDALVGVPDDRRDEKHVELAAVDLLEALDAAPSERSDLVAHFQKACRSALQGAPEANQPAIAVLPLATHVLAALKASG
jgi:hypothetical protein